MPENKLIRIDRPNGKNYIISILAREPKFFKNKARHTFCEITENELFKLQNIRDLAPKTKRYHWYNSGVDRKNLVTYKPKNPIDLIGQKFGRLTVIGIDEDYKFKYRRTKWLCKCDCGNIRSVRTQQLRTKTTQSCGCLRKQLAKERTAPPILICQKYVYTNYKSRARQKNFDFDISLDYFTSLTQEKCFYCNASPSNKVKRLDYEFFYNGIDRIDSTKGYVHGNIVPCCRTCNFAKGDSTLLDFFKWVEKIYKIFEARQKYINDNDNMEDSVKIRNDEYFNTLMNT